MQSPESDYYDFPNDWSSTRLTSEIASLEYKSRRRLNWTRIRPKIARHLYRYFAFNPEVDQSVARLEDLLVQSRLWLASPTDFNDPFDCRAHVVYEADPAVRRKKFDSMLRGIEPHLSGIARRRKIDQMMASRSPGDWHETTVKTITRHLESLGVCCFSEDPKSLLMWSHYAANHTGVCLQFESLRDIRTFSTAIPVRYTDDYPRINFFKYTGNELSQLMLSKFKHWAYEKERRIVAIGAAHKWLRFSSSALTGIILGAKADTVAEAKLRIAIQSRLDRGLPPIRIYKARQHPSSYKLIVQRID